MLFTGIDLPVAANMHRPSPSISSSTVDSGSPDESTVNEIEADEEGEEETIYFDEAFVLPEFNPLWHDSESPGDSISGVFRGSIRMLEPYYLLLHYGLPEPEENEEMTPETWIRDHYASNTDEVLFLKAMIYIFQHRESIALDKLIDIYRPVLRTAIPDSVFRERDYGRIIRWLNYAYHDMESGSEDSRYSSPLYGKVYDIMSEELSDYSGRYQKYHAKIADIALLDSVSSYSTFYEDQEAIVWAYSFWARRWKEGNISTARGVLSVLEEMYDIEEEINDN